MDYYGITIGLLIGVATLVLPALYWLADSYRRRLDAEVAAEDARRDERERGYNGTA